MVAVSYDDLMAQVMGAVDRSGREARDVTVVAVSKTMGVEDIMEVYGRGHRDFGENRAQELAEKAPKLPSDIRWHFVGGLQSRKARIVRPVSHLLHSMDRISLAEAWVKGPGTPPPVMVQVNVGREPQKSGVLPEEAEGLVARLDALDIEVRGLMAIPPIPERPEDSRPHFRELAQLRDRLSVDHPQLTELSMGMTDDFEVAIAEGASFIRVGRAIFGPRKSTEHR